MGTEQGLARCATRRAFLALSAAPLPAVALGGLCACEKGAGDGEAARQAVADELTALTGSSAQDLLGDAASGIEKLGLDCREFLSALLDGASWDIGEATLGGSAGSVHVAARRRVLSGVLSSFDDAYTAQALANGGHPEESELYEMAGEVLLECVRAAQLGEASADVAVVKADGYWTVPQEGQAVLTSLLLGS